MTCTALAIGSENESEMQEPRQAGGEVVRRAMMTRLSEQSGGEPLTQTGERQVLTGTGGKKRRVSTSIYYDLNFRSVCELKFCFQNVLIISPLFFIIPQVCLITIISSLFDRTMQKMRPLRRKDG